MSDLKKMKWLDFTPHGFFLVPSKLPSGITVLVMLGKVDSPRDKEGLSAHKFQKIADNTYFTTLYTREGGTISGLKPTEFQKYWPDMVIRELSYDQVYRPWTIQTNSTSSLVDNQVGPQDSLIDNSVKQNITQTAQATFLGLNEFGESVYQGVDGRFISNLESSISLENIRLSSPNRLLKVADLMQFNSAVKLEHMNSCAKGIFLEMLRGSAFDYIALKTKAAVLFDTTLEKLERRPDKGLAVFVSIQRAVEGVIASEMRNLLLTQDKPNIQYVADKYLALFERRPMVPRSEVVSFLNSSNSLISSEISPSMSKMIADFASSLPNHNNITIPFASSGAALSMIRPDLKINVISQERESGISKFGTLEHFKDSNTRFVDGDLFNGALDSKSTDCLIVNLPSGLMPEAQTIEGVSVQRYEHKLGIELLRSMKDDGKALLFLNGDGANSMGAVKSESFPFHSFIHQHYNVSAFIDIDGAMFGNTSIESTRAYVISGRKVIPTLDIEIPQTCDIFYSHESLINWSEQISDPAFTYVTPTKLQVAVVDEEISINEFQSKYIPVSDIGVPSSMIPKNLALPVRQGFIKFLTQHPDIVSYVCDRLQMDRQTLEEVLTPEQADAVALGIWRNESNLAFLNGDDTGEGKGRVQAAMMRYHALNGRKTIFFSSTPATFTDLWRDIVAIKSEGLFTPLIVNDNAKILDKSGNVIKEADPKTVSKYIENNTIPDENLIISTYSQVSRAVEYRALPNSFTKMAVPDKGSWLSNLAVGNFVTLDESHLAAGQSNINHRIETLLSRAAYTLYSSATWSKTEKNFSVYYKLLRGIEPTTITTAIEKGGDTLLEIFAASLAADGGFIRREKDISNLQFEAISEPNLLNRNIELNDSFARVMQGISILTGNLDRVINKSNSDLAEKLAANLPQNSRMKIKTRDIGLNTTGFSSQLSNITKQFLLSINSDLGAQVALDEVKKNRKPFLVIEFTGDSFIKLLFDKRKLEIEQGLATDFKMDGPPQFRDLVHAVLNRSLVITPRKTDAKPISYEDLLSGQQLVDFKAALASVREEIDNMPDLPFMPIDTIRHKVEAEGLTFAELTSRNVRIDKIDDNTFEFVTFKRPPSDVVDRCNQFNNGSLDVLLGAKPASAGISVHASKDYADTRQRTLIEVEVFRNISDRVQMLGRTNRRGQVCPPRVVSIGSGLPAQERFNAMSNAALMRMSANVTSNRNNAMYIDTTNLLNSEGDFICQKYLEVNPDYIYKLGLKHEDVYVKNLTKSSVESLSRKVTGRLTLLEYDEQEKVYQDLAFEYNARINDLNNRGINPFNLKHMDIKATETGRQLYKGTERSFYNSVFDEPIKLVEISYTEKVKPWNTDMILDEIDKNRTWFSKDVRVGPFESLKAFADIIKSRESSLLLGAADGDSAFLKAVQEDFINRRIAKASNQTYTPMVLDLKSEAIVKMIVRLEYLKETLPKLRLGSVVSMPENFYSDFQLRGDCVVTNIRMPQHGSEHNPSQYFFDLISPGESEPTQIALDTFFNSHNSELIKASVFDDAHPLASDFDSHLEADVYKDAITLEGNLFLAALECAEQGLGVPVTYTTENGENRRAIMLRHDLTVDQMIYRPITIRSSKMAADYLRSTPAHFISNTERRSDPGSMSIQMSQSKDRYIFTMPATVKLSRVFSTDDVLSRIRNGRPIDESRTFKSMDIFEDELDNFVNRLYKLGVSFITKSKGLEWVNRYESNQVNVKSPLLNSQGHTNHIINKVS
ncbi:helicase C-terminal domain-containing protein (plasmid) [Shewanella xiamenensis]|uniref:Helicase C-terminal domain-containing protein n=4 Tax=Shewanella xiamenensis TaxID=332186 RepID=A0ABT6UH07_9GAMM|nr:strawberry notch C-terminal domain-containing protein [Shewanella xiamenensis]MDI5833328.1 helicase C-terminal domain-containing protein [Shewanella xiamenensis]WHF57920.1 helicase C-terminal domain-containing protein [Shewanella xiamenensis]